MQTGESYLGCHISGRSKVVYYEEIKRGINRILIYECRCNERLRDVTEEMRTREE